MLIFFSSIATNGVDHLPFTIGFIFTFLCIPLGCYIAFNDIISQIDEKFLKTIFRYSLLFLALYGHFQFFYKLGVGHFFEIPYLTVNAQDIGILDTSKHIDRGAGLFKLISTYNNGNLFGVSLLMLLPFYNLCEKRWILRLIVKTSLLLTLSRTIWFGLIFSEMAHIFYVEKISIRSFAKAPIALAFYLLSIQQLSSILNQGEQFLTDTSLGGRERQFSTLDTFSFFPSQPFGGIDEIGYLSFLEQLGFTGLAAFLLTMLTPLFLYLIRIKKGSTQKAFALGMVTYLFVSVSDCAILYIPTMMIYSFIGSYLLREEVVMDHLSEKSKVV